MKNSEYIVYHGDVCKIIDKKIIRGMDYYTLIPIYDDSLVINIPVKNDKIRSLISKKQALDIISQIPNIPLIEAENDKYLETIYKDLLSNDDLLDLVKIIKTTYLRNQNRIDNGKKTGERDNNYLEKAEKRLYNELAIALNISIDEVISLIEKSVNN